jgi:probable O-glycosylation ligase (exosortase A-associated)
VRTFFVWAIVFLSLPIAFFQPFYGVLIWAWTSYFRPHDLAWGAGDLRLSYYIALATLGGVLFSRERFRIIPVRETFLCGALLVALMIAADHAEFSQGYAWEKVQQYGKVLLMTVLTAALVTSPGRFRILAWTIAISVGGLGFKGGLLGTIRGARLAGPGGFIADNNDFALALNMSLPFFLYLAQQSKRRFVKLALYFVFALSVIAIVLTYSRGGFIGLGMVMFMIWLRSKRKFVSAIVIVFAGILGFVAAPQSYIERIAGISKYKTDASAVGRLNAWQACWNIACEHPLTGIGPRNLVPSVFRRYAPHPEDYHVAHNIYFQTMADGGFLLLAIFLGLVFGCFLSLRKLRKQVPLRPDTEWFHGGCHMLEASFVAYQASGFFLSRNDFDLFYHLVGMVIALKALAVQIPRTVATDAKAAARGPRELAVVRLHPATGGTA